MLSLTQTRESGQGLVEYALIILLVAIAIAAGVSSFGTMLSGVISGLGASL
jgi:Flp pilus assembly pilin Flp